MINIDKEQIEVRGDLKIILAELASAITALNDRYNSMEGVEKDIFIKTLLAGLMHLMLGGENSAGIDGTQGIDI